ncbi:MAG TPA: thioesterase domain-containing protein [Candidatus Dormibacteraeota bacterium]|nr:thioesterase domain-containing protein [Candidatus Dormibacteraeota bacterium]
MTTGVYVAQGQAAGEGEATQQLTRIWEDLLRTQPIEPDQNYFELGGDSSLAAQMFAQIEKVFDVKLPLATLFEAPTIADLAEILSREAPKSRWSSLVTIQPKGSRPPFFCVHPHGGNVLVYRDLSRHVGDDQPFYGLQSLGLDGSRKPLKRIEDMAKAYIDEIRRVQPSGPYFLGGYCLGGAVAYEMAQQLQAQGEQTALLALFDTLNWTNTPPLSFWENCILLAERQFFHLTNFFSLDGAERKEFFREKMSSLRGRVPVWWKTLLSKFFGGSDPATSVFGALGRVWKANFQAYLDYVPRPYPGSLIDFRPARQYNRFVRPELKWDKLAQGGVRIVVLPINATAMLFEPFVRHLAAALRESMDKAIQNLEKNPIHRLSLLSKLAGNSSRTYPE